MTNQKRGLPLGILAVGLLLTLAMIGVVNGLWSKNLVVNGTVETGDLNVDWLDARCGDENPWVDPDGSQASDPGEFLGKDVGWTEAGFNTDDHQILNVILFNVYPSYFVDCELEWQNTGTIPVNFTGYGFDWSRNLTGCEVTEIVTELVLDCDQLTVVVVNDIGQVDPGEIVSRSFKVHVEQPAAQSTCSATGSGVPWQIGGPEPEDNLSGLNCPNVTRYGFQVKICVAQWNEDPNGDGIVGANPGDYVACADSLQHEGPPGGAGDGDGILDPDDNCPDVPNPNQNPEACDGLDNDADGLIDEPDEDQVVV